MAEWTILGEGKTKSVFIALLEKQNVIDLAKINLCFFLLMETHKNIN